jgi:polyisoprenyl-teichoic acid--peptidoglycan teichoic acid transferase
VSRSVTDSRPELDADVATARPRRGWGRRRRRTELRRARRRRRARRAAVAVLVLAALAGLGWWLAPQLGLLAGDEPAAPVDQAAADEEVPTLLVATFAEEEPGAGASLVFVLGGGPGAGDATVLFVPVSTVTDVPGHGLDRVGDALAYGGGPLVAGTVDNLLGLHPDAVVTVSDRGWGAIVDRLGGITVDLPSAVRTDEPDGTTRVRFPAGEQDLTGDDVAELLGAAVSGEGELEHVARVRRVLDAIFAGLVAVPDALGEVPTDGSPTIEASVPVEVVRAVFAAAAQAHEAGRLDSLVVPVSPLTAGDERSLRIDGDRAEALVADRFPTARSGAQAEGRRLQILNGNGRPGIGQHVAARVLPEGYRVVLTDNADRFDHEVTRVIAHGDDEAVLERARELVTLLGTGEVEISRTPQSVVDVTIVVGHDFLDVVDEASTSDG